MLYLLQRRGFSDPGVLNAVIVSAISPAHARVAAYGRSGQMEWTSETYSTCVPLNDDNRGVQHSLYK